MKVSLVCAISLDGFINHEAKARVTFSSDQDKAWFKQKTKEAGVMVMGATTYQYNFGHAMPDRLAYVLTHHPESIEAEENVIATSASPTEILKEIEQKGFTECTLIGGGKINSLFLQAGLIDDVWLTITQYYFGGGVPLFAGNPSVEFELLGTKPLGPSEILAHYKIKK